MDSFHHLATGRQIVRLLGGTALAVPLALRVESADAGRGWCRMDPDVYLEGTYVQVQAGVPEEYLPLVSGPSRLWFNLPSQVDRQFAWADAGFNDYGYDVSFSKAFQPNKPCAKLSVNLTIKVPIWYSATPSKGTDV
jgi:hypothetical protein